MNSKIDYLICPQCKTQLQLHAATWVCENCHQQFAYRHGIPVLYDMDTKSGCTTVPEGLISHIDEALDRRREDEKVWARLLLKIIQFYATARDRNRIVLNLVDESKTASKFLLNLSPQSHVLNLGPGWDNTTINLARCTHRVTVLDLDLYRLYVLMLKKQYYALKNVDLICSGTGKYLPIEDQTLDAVFVQDGLKWSLLSFFFNTAENPSDFPTDFTPLLGFLRELNRILKPQGELFWGIEGLINRQSFENGIHEIVAHFPKADLNRRSVKPLVRRLITPRTIFRGKQGHLGAAAEKAGFKKGKLYALSPNSVSPKRIFELSKDKDAAKLFGPVQYIKAIVARKKRYRTGSYVGYSAKKTDSPESWISGMLADLAASAGFDEHMCVWRNIHVTRKGKFVVLVEKTDPAGDTLVIKVPFHEIAQSLLERNHLTLSRLNKIKKRFATSNVFLQAIPGHTYQGEYDGQAYFAETGVIGTAWGHMRPVFADNNIWRQLIKILQSMNQLPVGKEVVEDIVGQYEQKLDCLQGIIEDDEKRAKQAFGIVRDRVVGSLRRAGSKIYFRKGDFSMHNVIVGPERKPQLIDFDEAGYTPFKSVDLADILFSYVRVRKKINREMFLKAMIGRDYKKLSLKIKTDDMLDMLDADEEDLTLSSLVSWLDHVYCAIQFEPIRYRKYILNKSFSQTLLALGSAFQTI